MTPHGAHAADMEKKQTLEILATYLLFPRILTALRSTITIILTFLLCAENEAIPVQNSSNFHDFGIEIFESCCICI